jgi:hypothetical protein
MATSVGYVLSSPTYTVIASIGFWTMEHPGKALTARALKLWYEAELDREAAVRKIIRKT